MAAPSAIDRMPVEERRGRQHHIGAEHHQFAMREIEHAADAIDQHIAARDQRVDRREDDDVDGELHEDSSGADGIGVASTAGAHRYDGLCALTSPS